MAIEKLMKLSEVAEVIGWGKTRTHQAVVTGELPGMVVSEGPKRRCWRVRPSELDRWLKERELR